MLRATLIAIGTSLPGIGNAQQVEAMPSRLSVHGYLTQAYGQSDRGLVMGLTREGTTDYRRAAILGRYAVSTKDALVVQLGHRRLGDSPTMDFERETVKLDMAFYERRFDSGTRLRVGRSVIPYGIFNEVRYAGTLLPFYRVPFTFYAEGTYSSESIDGVVLSKTVRAGEPWELSLDAYGGNFELLEFATIPTGPTTPPVYIGAKIKAKNALGGQLWVSTPLSGLRIGGSARTEEHFAGVFPRPNGVSATTLAASLDAAYERWQFRAEASRVRTYGVRVPAGYAQLGVRMREWLQVNLQAEYVDFDFEEPAFPDVDLSRDRALGLNLFFSPMMVLKLELHGTKGFAYEEVVTSTVPLKGAYFISSFSVAF